jgi:thiosulfate reductase cytochrome b subunit
MKSVYLHPLTVRIWHWTNAAIVIALLVTGAQLRIPELRILPTYSQAAAIHKYVGFAMGLSFLFWLPYSLISSGLRRHYLLRVKDLRAIVGQALFYLFGIFSGWKNPFEPTPDNKFNPLQKIAYSSVMLIFTPIIVVTGILFSDLVSFALYVEMLHGVRVLDAIHVVMAYVFVLYLAVHLYMSTLGSTVFEHVRAMITGRVEHKERHKKR